MVRHSRVPAFASSDSSGLRFADTELGRDAFLSLSSGCEKAPNFRDLLFGEYGPAVLFPTKSSENFGGVDSVFFAGSPLKIFNSVVEFISAQMVYFWPVRIFSAMGQKNQPMNLDLFFLAADGEADNVVPADSKYLFEDPSASSVSGTRTNPSLIRDFVKSLVAFDWLPDFFGHDALRSAIRGLWTAAGSHGEELFGRPSLAAVGV